MSKRRNISTLQIALLTAIWSALPLSLVLYYYQKNIVLAAIAFIVVFAISYFTVLYSLNEYIYRRIKLIYKFIYNTKATKREETYYKYLLPRKNLTEVENIVHSWARKNSEELEVLRANEKFRREFLQNLSHEFKTPVFAIQGYIDILLQGEFSNPETNKKYLGKAAANITRLTNLLNDLDEISSLERGELKLVKQNFVIQNLVKEALDNLTVKMERKNISWQFKKGSEAPLYVFADKEKIHQVLMNLISNSVKYGKTGGKITVGIYKTEAANILIELSDDGIGISEEYLPRIFERFYRTEEGRTKSINGSGLGLAICKHIIEAHEQTIHVRSRVNVGTTVGFTLESKKE